MIALDRSFFAREATTVAPQLLNKVLRYGACTGRIIEVEAYLQDDPASHSFRGRTPRNRAMFGAPGHLYVYLIYGMHHCANVVTGAVDDGQAVLIRAVTPRTGLDEMIARRGRTANLCGGPGVLCQAFGIDRTHDGSDLCAEPASASLGISIWDDGTPAPTRPTTSRRVGIRVGRDLPWRYRASPE